MYKKKLFAALLAIAAVSLNAQTDVNKATCISESWPDAPVAVASWPTWPDAPVAVASWPTWPDNAV